MRKTQPSDFLHPSRSPSQRYICPRGYPRRRHGLSVKRLDACSWFQHTDDTSPGQNTLAAQDYPGLQECWYHVETPIKGTSNSRTCFLFPSEPVLQGYTGQGGINDYSICNARGEYLGEPKSYNGSEKHDPQFCTNRSDGPRFTVRSYHPRVSLCSRSPLLRRSRSSDDGNAEDLRPSQLQNRHC